MILTILFNNFPTGFVDRDSVLSSTAFGTDVPSNIETVILVIKNN